MAKRDIKIGPAGLGPVKTATEVLEQYHEKGLTECELAFTYQVYIKDPEDAKEIGKRAKELGINLTIHAPYFVNLNSDKKETIEASKQRILRCVERGHQLGATKVVFHPGYYGKDRSEEGKKKAYENVKKAVKEMEEKRKEQGWTTKLAPEVMGKINVFGSPEEISQLVEDTGCSFCIDFAHLLAREGKVDYEKIAKLFPWKDWHVHFSGIVYGEKGEKHHKNLEDGQWEELLKNIPENKKVTIACESPDLVGDAEKGVKALGKLD